MEIKPESFTPPPTANAEPLSGPPKIQTGSEGNDYGRTGPLHDGSANISRSEPDMGCSCESQHGLPSGAYAENLTRVLIHTHDSPRQHHFQGEIWRFRK